MMSNRKYQPISIHQTLKGTLKIDWESQYNDEYSCIRCGSKLKNFSVQKKSKCKLDIFCTNCNKTISLTNKVPAYTYNYRPQIECPNPLCTQIGHDGQKGWIYLHSPQSKKYRCRFCRIIFDNASTHYAGWIGSLRESKLLPFSFEKDTWDLRHFYEKPKTNKLYFQKVYPQWYRIEVKKYLHYLLKAKIYSADSTINSKLSAFRQLGEIITSQKILNSKSINRNIIVSFLDRYKNNKNEVINVKLSTLRDFFEWLNLDVSLLIRSRDFLKENRNDVDWLDEVTRQGIEQNLDKIPPPIGRQYLIQAYIAARPGDVCHLCFDCLVEENGKWYIQFFQQKKNRHHKILVSRKIRSIIEKQQQWIKDTFGENYSYLFCHFRGIHIKSYPSFLNIKPLPIPPHVDASNNPLIRIIRLLIERENIIDANGRKPNFTGKITRSSRLQEVRAKYGIKAAQLYADHETSKTTFQHYAPPTSEQVALVDLPFQELLMNPENKFLPWQSLPESLLKNPKAHELDLEIAPRLVVYGHCALNPKTPCPINLFPSCYGCSSFRPSTGKLPLYERQYEGEQKRLAEAEKIGASLAYEEAKATIEAMDKWLPELKNLANG